MGSTLQADLAHVGRPSNGQGNQTRSLSINTVVDMATLTFEIQIAEGTRWTPEPGIKGKC